VSDSINKEGNAKDRLLTMKNCYDGFEIAERDLAMRGPGDFLRGSGDETVRQSGGVRFKLAVLCDDNSVLSSAFEEAKLLLASSPDLSEYPALAREVDKMFTLEKGTIN
jgi:ATP-dependent DNA helicase RecG